MKETFPTLQNCPLFADIAAEDIPVMLGCLGGTVAAYNKKEVILAEGDPAKYIGIVLSGRVQIVRVDYFGSRSIVASIEKGGIFGETFSCAGAERMPADVIAVEDTKVLLIDCFRVLHSCSHACSFHQQMIYNLMKVVAAKNLLFHEKLEILSRRTTRDKLLAYLALQAKKQGSASFEIPFDRQELADYLEVDRSGLSAEISRMRKEGILECEKNRFTLLPACEEHLSPMY